MKISVSEMETVTFKDLITVADGAVSLTLKFSNYVFITEDDLYFKTYLSSLKYAGCTTIFCLLIGYPFAYFMARAKPTAQPALLMLVMLPFWTSFLLRVYAWKGLLSENGWAYDLLVGSGLDQVMASMGLVPAPGQLMNSPFSLVLGMTYTYLPFMILPLFGNLVKMDLALLEAAADLGATPWQTFRHVILPLIAPSLVGIGMFGFTLSWDEIARTSQAIGDVNTLPLELQGLTSTVTTPSIYALGTVTMVVSFLVMGLTVGLARLLEKRQRAAP